ncbi:phosphotransferase family protein [Pseudonocardia spinosispora]|uniref:phosphotransferase family protein n=1 Tax=Pseudonocardia spinosispora TaxID=103441 RepID=UPI0003F5D965|nr:phosphotransferase family protein [Pseudonocardia spinosispora]
MALTNKIDPVEAAMSLTRWLSERMPEATGLRVSDVRVPSSNGLSTETVLFTASWQQGSQAMVARVQPDGEGVFPSYDLAKEAAVMRALADNTPVPAPRVLFYEDDPAVLGAPFLVMEHVDGRIPSDDPPFTAAGWVLDLEPEQRLAMWENSLTVLADIHAADHRELGLPEGGLPEQLATWEDFFRWASKGEPNPTIEAALAWLRDNQPADDEKVLNWGDARVGNLIFGDDLGVGAVLDWEMVTLASREQDLGWWLFLMRHHTEGIGLPLPDGIPDAAETVAFYEKVAGTQARNLEYYEVFAGTRLAIIMVRAAHMLIGVGALPPDNPMALNNPASQLVAKLLGLPAPSGDTTSFIGNR